MNEKRTTGRIREADVPYDPKDKAAEDRKEQISLRVDKDVLEWYRAQGAGWQTRMNAVLKAFRDATR